MSDNVIAQRANWARINNMETVHYKLADVDKHIQGVQALISKNAALEQELADGKAQIEHRDHSIAYWKEQSRCRVIEWEKETARVAELEALLAQAGKQPTAPEAEAFDVEYFRYWLKEYDDAKGRRYDDLYEFAKAMRSEVKGVPAALREIERLEERQKGLCVMHKDRVYEAADWKAEAERLRAGLRQALAVHNFGSGQNVFVCESCRADVDANGNGDHLPTCVTSPQTEEGL